MFDGRNVWPLAQNDHLAREAARLSGVSLYEWDGERWVQTRPQ